MKRISFFVIGAALLLNLVPAFLPAADSATGVVNWLTFDEAQKRGQGQSQKFLLYFYTDWCGYCRKLDQKTFADQAVADYINANFIPVRINSERLPQVAGRYGVGGVPDLRFLTAKGEDIARWPGYIEADRFLPLLKYIQSDSYQKMSYGDFIKQQR
jgi:hypothetical protein